MTSNEINNRKKLLIPDDYLAGFWAWWEANDFPRSKPGISINDWIVQVFALWLTTTVPGGQVLHRFNEAQEQRVLDFEGRR